MPKTGLPISGSPLCDNRNRISLLFPAIASQLNQVIAQLSKRKSPSSYDEGDFFY